MTQYSYLNITGCGLHWPPSQVEMWNSEFLSTLSSLTQLGLNPADSTCHNQIMSNQPNWLLDEQRRFQVHPDLPASAWKCKYVTQALLFLFLLHGHKIKGETWQLRENHHRGYLVYHKKVFIEDFQDYIVKGLRPILETSISTKVLHIHWS